MERIDGEGAAHTDVLSGYVTLEALSKAIHKSKRTLQRLHAKREGPPRVKVGRLILYNIEDVRQWLESNTEAMPQKHQPSLDIKKALIRKKMTLTRA